MAEHGTREERDDDELPGGRIVWGALFIVMGAWWLLGELDIVAFSWSLVGPLAIIAVGIGMLLNWRMGC